MEKMLLISEIAVLARNGTQRNTETSEYLSKNFRTSTPSYQEDGQFEDSMASSEDKGSFDDVRKPFEQTTRLEIMNLLEEWEEPARAKEDESVSQLVRRFDYSIWTSANNSTAFSFRKGHPSIPTGIFADGGN
jgi:hypothetical protein